MNFPIISLGTNCEITFNLRKTFGVDRAYPFDWWITPIEYIARIIEEKIYVDISKENLSIVGNGQSVLNRRYKILHHHDFRRGSDGLISREWDNEITHIKEKYCMLSKRFFNDISSAEKALFVLNRDGSHRWADRSGDRVLSHSYTEIANVLRQSFPNLRFRLAIFNATDEGVRQACAADHALWLAPPVVDHGDREGGDLGHFAGSLKGWRAVLEQAMIGF